MKCDISLVFFENKFVPLAANLKKKQKKEIQKKHTKKHEAFIIFDCFSRHIC